MAQGQVPKVEAAEPLACPPDVAGLLDVYASQLSNEFLFPVTRQQAFERLVRVFVQEDGHAETGAR